MARKMRLALGVAVVAALAIGLATGVLLTQTSRAQPAPPPMQGQPLSHDEMHQMMDAMHGDGTSDRMHAALGEDADRMIEQCRMMMAMMPGMAGMGR